MWSAPSLLMLYFGVLAVGLLAPFDVYTRNGATWLVDADGVEFVSPGILRSPGLADRLHADLTSGAGLTVELRAASYVTEQTGPARIVSYSLSAVSRNFTVGQDGSALVVRLRTSETGDNGIPDLLVADVFTPGAWRHVVITYDFRVLCAYVDGERRTCRSSPAGDFSTWDPSHELLIGNEGTADRPWLGAVSLVALYNRPLSAAEIERRHRPVAIPVSGSPPGGSDGLVALYRFAERTGDTVADSSARSGSPLVIPRVVERVGPFLSRRSALASRPLRPYDIFDGVVNLLMFVPFGFLTCLVLEARGWSLTTAVTVAIAATAAFCLAAESTQYFLVSRSSELQDVALNMISGALGSLLYLLRRRRSQPDIAHV